MTPQEAVLRMRSLADENGITSGFWDDTNDLYKYADAGEKEIENVLIRNFRELREKNPAYENPSLAPLIKSGTINITGGSGEYSLSSFTDYIETYSVEYIPDSVTRTGKYYKATYLPYNEVRERSGNSLLAGNVDNGDIYFYVNSGSIGFDPVPTGSVTPGVKIFYLFKPATITSASSAFAVPQNCHEIIPIWGLAMMLLKEQRYNEASAFLKQFYEGIPV